MKMFLGEYNPSITEGSRVALPKRMREQIESNNLVLAKGFEKCIFVYAKEDWLVEANRQVEDIGDKGKTRKMSRYLYTSATEVVMDSQGRFVVSPALKSYAGIKSKTAVLGVGNRIEIWDDKTWCEYKKTAFDEPLQ